MCHSLEIAAYSVICFPTRRCLNLVGIPCLVSIGIDGNILTLGDTCFDHSWSSLAHQTLLVHPTTKLLLVFTCDQLLLRIDGGEATRRLLFNLASQQFFLDLAVPRARLSMTLEHVQFLPLLTRAQAVELWGQIMLIQRWHRVHSLPENFIDIIID